MNNDLKSIDILYTIWGLQTYISQHRHIDRTLYTQSYNTGNECWANQLFTSFFMSISIIYRIFSYMFFQMELTWVQSQFYRVYSIIYVVKIIIEPTPTPQFTNPYVTQGPRHKGQSRSDDQSVKMKRCMATGQTDSNQPTYLEVNKQTLKSNISLLHINYKCPINHLQVYHVNLVTFRIVG